MDYSIGLRGGIDRRYAVCGGWGLDDGGVGEPDGGVAPVPGGVVPVAGGDVPA